MLKASWLHVPSLVISVTMVIVVVRMVTMVVVKMVMMVLVMTMALMIPDSCRQWHHPSPVHTLQKETLVILIFDICYFFCNICLSLVIFRLDCIWIVNLDCTYLDCKPGLYYVDTLT